MFPAEKFIFSIMCLFYFSDVDSLKNWLIINYHFIHFQISFETERSQKTCLYGLESPEILEPEKSLPEIRLGSEADRSESDFSSGLPSVDQHTWSLGSKFRLNKNGRISSSEIFTSVDSQFRNADFVKCV